MRVMMTIDALLYCLVASSTSVRSYGELVEAASRCLEVAMLLMFRQNESNM